MATQRKTTKKKTTTRKPATKKLTREQQEALETKRAYYGLVFLGLAIFTLFSIFNPDGAFVLSTYRNLVTFVIGYGIYYLPFSLGVIGIYCFTTFNGNTTLRCSAFLLFSVVASSFTQLVNNGDEYTIAKLGNVISEASKVNSGGLFGGLIAIIFDAGLTRVGAMIFFCLVIAGTLFVGFNITPSQLTSKLKSYFDQLAFEQDEDDIEYKKDVKKETKKIDKVKKQAQKDKQREHVEQLREARQRAYDEAKAIADVKTPKSLKKYAIDLPVHSDDGTIPVSKGTANQTVEQPQTSSFTNAQPMQNANTTSAKDELPPIRGNAWILDEYERMKSTNNAPKELKIDKSPAKPKVDGLNVSEALREVIDLEMKAERSKIDPSVHYALNQQAQLGQLSSNNVNTSPANQFLQNTMYVPNEQLQNPQNVPVQNHQNVSYQNHGNPNVYNNAQTTVYGKPMSYNPTPVSQPQFNVPQEKPLTQEQIAINVAREAQAMYMAQQNQQFVQQPQFVQQNVQPQQQHQQQFVQQPQAQQPQAQQPQQPQFIPQNQVQQQFVPNNQQNMQTPNDPNGQTVQFSPIKNTIFVDETKSTMKFTPIKEEQALDPMRLYSYPPITLLSEPISEVKVDPSEELRESSTRLIDTLQSFGIKSEVVHIVRGPSISRFEITIPKGVKISKFTSLADDMALSVGAANVRIATIPEKGTIGIEVPNKNVDMVSIREVLDTPEFVNTTSKLSYTLGKDITGRPVIGDIAKMPHMLIAGTTGAGKSVCVNAMLVSLLYKANPEEVKFIMIDPKMVELGGYNGIPHLLIPVVTEPKKAAGALNWAVGEMDRRYTLLASNGAKDIASFNNIVEKKRAEGNTELEKLPQIVIVIDELADLMMVAAKEVEESICRIAQKARAAGMHLVIATQRPSADVITGIMKANVPSRVSFAVSSSIDSRIILDVPGAEKLIGKGDMLYSPVGVSSPTRLQCCFISGSEVEAVVDYVKSMAEPEYNDEVMNHIETLAQKDNKDSSGSSNGSDDDEDDLIIDAIDAIVSSGQASTSFLQRKLKVGYSRAARIIDQIEDRGIIGSSEGSKGRPVLISKYEWQEMKNRMCD